MPGGIGTYVRGLQQGLASTRHADVDVSPWSSLLPVRMRSRLWDAGIGRVGGDVVHAPALAFPPRARRLVVVAHDVSWRDVPEAFPARGRAWHERQLGRAIARADRLVAPSTPTADRLAGAGADPARVVVIEEGCDHLPAPDVDAARAVVDGEFVLTVGTREPRKNLDRLIEAHRRADTSLPLVVVGPRGWGSDADLRGVIVTGAISEAALAGLYARARTFVYVPLVEGFGLPPVEAMRAGVPVVASTAVPSVGGAALAVDPLDVDAIAHAIARVTADDECRADLIGRGTSRAASLTWARAAEAHLELWRTLA